MCLAIMSESLGNISMQNCFYCYHKNVDILNQAKPCNRVFKLIKDFERYSGTKACILINITMKPNITRSGSSNCLQQWVL
jgi:hypothetical protein